MALLCLMLIPVAFALSAPACAMALRIGRRVGAVDSTGVKGQIKLATRRVPNTGGVGIFVALALPLAGALALAFAPEGVRDALPERVAGLLPGVRDEAGTALVFLVSLAALHALGLIDDRRPLGPGLKLVVMLAVAAAAPILADTRLLTALDGPAGGVWASVLLTTLWIAVVVNALNFMDNMDGLAATTGAVAAAGFLAATLMNGQWFVASALALIVGACLGFLVFNFPPARLYMGDSGSLVLGYALAFLTVRTSYYIDPSVGDATAAHPVGGGWYGVLMPLAVLALPLYDLVGVTIIRLSQGRSPFVGDTQHLSHRLLKRGLSTRQALFVVALLTGVTAVCGVLLATPIAGWQALLIGVAVALTLGAVAVLEIGSTSTARPLPSERKITPSDGHSDAGTPPSSLA